MDPGRCRLSLISDLQTFHLTQATADGLLGHFLNALRGERVLLLLHFHRDSSNEQVGIQVEALGTTRTLALHVGLIVHAEHGVAPVARHHQLMPAALGDLHFADHCFCARARVEPEEVEYIMLDTFLPPLSTLSHKHLELLYFCPP